MNSGTQERTLDPLPSNAARSAVETAPETNDVDANGDIVFRFKLVADPALATLPLSEIYRQSIHDLLKLVRFYSVGQPVAVDAFAFLNDLDTRIDIRP
jgi:hypothetical protein